MKALRTLITVVSLGAIFFFSGCKPSGGNSETLQDKQLGLLSKTWKVTSSSGSVMYGASSSVSVDSTTHWTNFTLTISGTAGATSFNYACTGRPKLSAWPANGTWAFGSLPASQIIRDQSGTSPLAMTYTVTATTLQLTFQYTGSGYTRADNVGGFWTFNLVAQ